MAELGDDSGFDRKHGFQGACRARYLVKLSEKIVANDENYALAA